MMELIALSSKTRFLGLFLFGNSCGMLLTSFCLRLCSGTSYFQGAVVGSAGTFVVISPNGSLGIHVTGLFCCIVFFAALWFTAVLNVTTARANPVLYGVNMQLFGNPRLGGPMALLYQVLTWMAGGGATNKEIERNC